MMENKKPRRGSKAYICCSQLIRIAGGWGYKQQLAEETAVLETRQDHEGHVEGFLESQKPTALKHPALAKVAVTARIREWSNA